jgi:hypothetical protein
MVFRVILLCMGVLYVLAGTSMGIRMVLGVDTSGTSFGASVIPQLVKIAVSFFLCGVFLLGLSVWSRGLNDEGDHAVM